MQGHTHNSSCASTLERQQQQQPPLQPLQPLSLSLQLQQGAYSILLLHLAPGPGSAVCSALPQLQQGQLVQPLPQQKQLLLPRQLRWLCAGAKWLQRLRQLPVC